MSECVFRAKSESFEITTYTGGADMAMCFSYIYNEMPQYETVFLNRLTFRFFPPLLRDRFWEAPRILSNGYRGIFPVVKVPEREADYLPSFSAKFKNARSFTSSPIRLRGVMLKYRDNVTPLS